NRAPGPIPPHEPARIVPSRKRTMGVPMSASVNEDQTIEKKSRSRTYTPYLRPLREKLFSFVQLLVLRPRFDHLVHLLNQHCVYVFAPLYSTVSIVWRQSNPIR